MFLHFTTFTGLAGTPPPCWPTLTRLCVRFNSITDMDVSLQLLPKLEALCLTDNALVRVESLQHCTSLTRLVGTGLLVWTVLCVDSVV